jgi:hypothetical protein
MNVFLCQDGWRVWGFTHLPPNRFRGCWQKTWASQIRDHCSWHSHLAERHHTCTCCLPQVPQGGTMARWVLPSSKAQEPVLFEWSINTVTSSRQAILPPPPEESCCRHLTYFHAYVTGSARSQASTAARVWHMQPARAGMLGARAPALPISIHLGGLFSNHSIVWEHVLCLCYFADN